MATVEQFTAAIAELSPDQVSHIREWLNERAEAGWDAQIEQDARAGRLDALADRDPWHPSLHFQRVGRLWSVRVAIGYRALAVADDDGPVWFWIGSHAEYDRIVLGVGHSRQGNACSVGTIGVRPEVGIGGGGRGRGW